MYVVKCGNFYLAPGLYERWTAKQKEAIRFHSRGYAVAMTAAVEGYPYNVEIPRVVRLVEKSKCH